MAKKKKPVTAKKPNKSQIAASRHIQTLVDNAKGQGQGPESSKALIRCSGPKRPIGDKDKPTLAQLPKPNTFPIPTITLSIPKAPKSTSRPLDPLSAENESRFLINDKRHENQGLILLPATSRPHVNLPISSYTRPEPFRFLDLAQEIQDMIYDYLIPKDTFHLVWVNGRRQSRSLTYWYPFKDGGPDLLPGALEHRRQSRRLPYAFRKPFYQKIYQYPSPVSLLWVCRAMYDGASKKLYSRSTFRFSRLKTLRHFLNTVSEVNKSQVHSLRLIHRSYGHPSLTKDAPWKAVADLAWQVMCERVQDELPAIQTLGLELYMSTCPISFGPLHREMISIRDFTKQWMVALLPFKQLNLKHVIFRIRSFMKEDTVLEVESYNLRKELTGQNWDELRERSHDAYGHSRRTKKPMVLRIALND